MEYCQFGDLSVYIKQKREKRQHFSEEEIIKILLQICSALEYIHDKNIIHRDLKAKNIFLSSNLEVKLGDFGISKILDNT